MTEITASRTADTIAAEIRTFTASMLNNIIEIGRRLCEAKELIPYGSFGDWVRRETGYSVSTANNFMRIFTEYGAAQGCLFGAEAESQTFGKLSYSKALALLAVPAEEREQFAQEHHVEDMSTRELKEAIRENERLRQEAEGSALTIADLEEARNAIAEQLVEEKEHAAKLKARIKELENRPVEVAVEAADPEEIEAAVGEALRKQANENKRQMDELMGKLQVSSAAQASAEAELINIRAKLDKAKNELKEAKAKAESARKAGAEQEKANADKARADADAARAEAERLKKELAMANPEATQFRLQFDELQALINSQLGIILKAAPEQAEKYRKAMTALLRAALGQLGPEGGMSNGETDQQI